jgi:hypothetical protein
MHAPRPHTLALAALLGTGCPEKQVQSFSPTHDLELLAQSAELFWHSLRWSDMDGAASLLEETDPRLDFLTVWSTDPPAQITDYELIHLELLPVEPEAEHLEGLVVIKVEGISTGTYTLETLMLRQHWYRAGESWYIEPESLPFRD